MNAAMHARSFCTQMKVQRRIASAVAVAVVAAGTLLLAPPAFAEVSHVYTTSFGAASSIPANPYPLSGPTDVAVDETSHDFYVTDPDNQRVEKFDSAGNFLLMFGKGVDQTTGGNVCPVSPGDVCQAGTPGTSSGAFETPTYLAVDNYPGGEGDVYVGDTNLVQKFDSSGHIISTWGIAGQKDGADASDLPVFGPLFGIAVGGPAGKLYVGGTRYGSYRIYQYTQNGTYIENTGRTGELGLPSIPLYPWLKADASGKFYYSDANDGSFGPPTVWQGIPQSGNDTFYPLGTATPLTGFGLDSSSREVYQDTGSVIDRYSGDCDPVNGPCDPVDSFGSAHLSGAQGVAVDGVSHTVYVANSASSNVAVFGDARPIVTTGQATNVTESSVTLTGHIDPAGRGDITSCHFEYGFDKTYGAILPCTPDPASNPPGSNFTGPTDVTATLTGLSPGTKDHYRLVASNDAGGTTRGLDQTFIATQAPAIDGLASANLTATSADLNAQVNPNGLPTKYRFEYGLTTSYGQAAPVPDGTLSASNSDQSISVHLDNLVPNTVYHYRLIVTNDDGTTTAVDHTFNFFPPPCPNENVRQQTQADYLPDCRAYELVSPGDAGGTQLYPSGPNTGYATNPSRLSFTGLWSTIPGSGGSPIGSVGDLYVSTRTDTGWVTRYIGPPANQVAAAGGPPPGLWGQGTLTQPNRTSVSRPSSDASTIQNNVLTDPGMNTFLDWSLGSGLAGGNPTPISSNAPYVWSADGSFLDRWPTNLAIVPSGVNPGLDGGLSPGGVDALDCPGLEEAGGGIALNNCPGEVSTSADLSHFVFSSEWNVFAPGGQLSPPGSVYDNNTVAGTIAVASKTPAGDDIPSEPGDAAGDPLQMPAVSGNGSHILITAGGTGPCGLSSCPTPPCTFGTLGGSHCPPQPSHLYMRVNGALTYDVSEGHDVSYVGSTADASKVYFTTDQQLTADDHDASIDLYMWAEATNSLTLVSKGSNGTGNSDACNASFTTNCGVVTYSNQDYCQLVSGLGGNCRSDNLIASSNGDIYFFSPEQLDGSRGIPNKENFYVSRNGNVQYVATLTTGGFCYPIDIFAIDCNGAGVESDGPVVRMQVSPDGSHMAFLTASPVTQYDNAGHLEMYTYDPSTRTVICVSCIPSGAPPTSDVGASQDGLFMTNDGRAFFTTDDALVHADTNQAQDVYEYVDGHAQLITPGTGETSQSRGQGLNVPGLNGVSADGRDVYFSTYNTLVRQDHNGLFLKFYDARAGGGFSDSAPPPPCEAADECHGAGSAPQAALPYGTRAALGARGNVTPQTGKTHKKRTHHHKRAHKRRHASTNRRVGK